MSGYGRICSVCGVSRKLPWTLTGTLLPSGECDTRPTVLTVRTLNVLSQEPVSIFPVKRILTPAAVQAVLPGWFSNSASMRTPSTLAVIVEVGTAVHGRLVAVEVVVHDPMAGPDEVHLLNTAEVTCMSLAFLTVVVKNDSPHGVPVALERMFIPKSGESSVWWEPITEHSCW
jgi:hypothetical protein